MRRGARRCIPSLHSAPPPPNFPPPKVTERAVEGKHFGVVLIPEGLIEYIPEVNALLREIMMARVQKARTKPAILALLTPWSAALLQSMPPFIQQQLLLEAQASLACVKNARRRVPGCSGPLATSQIAAHGAVCAEAV